MTEGLTRYPDTTSPVDDGGRADGEQWLFRSPVSDFRVVGTPPRVVSSTLVDTECVHILTSFE